MAANIPFIKMHGLGNDFVVITLDGELSYSHDRLLALLQSIAPGLLSRTRGVGGDGILLVSELDRQNRSARMSIINRDGSTAGMCGNGARCVVHVLGDRWNERDRQEPISLVVGERAMRCSVRKTIGPKSVEVSVDMGRPVFRLADIPFVSETGTDDDLWIENPITLRDGTRVVGTAVSMGNPHFIISNRSYTPEERDRVAPLVEHATYFPNRTNVSFVRIHSEHSVDVTVWERGVGYTEACGSAACASFAALLRAGRISSRAQITLPGGVLELALSESNDSEGSLLMTGPSVKVFDGSFNPDEFLRE